MNVCRKGVVSGDGDHQRVGVFASGGGQKRSGEASEITWLFCGLVLGLEVGLRHAYCPVSLLEKSLTLLTAILTVLGCFPIWPTCRGNSCTFGAVCVQFGFFPSSSHITPCT